MGGKGSKAPVQQGPDMGEMMAQQAAMMQQMMASMGAMSAPSMPSAPEPPPAPAIDKPAEIDWKEKQDQLSKKASASYNLDEARRKGRMDTVLTSPLLDEEEANVSGSILGT